MRRARAWGHWTLMGALTWMAPAQELRPREAAPGPVQAWAKRFPNRPVALVMQAEAPGRGECETVAAALREWKRFGLAGLLVEREGAPACAAIAQVDRVADTGGVLAGEGRSWRLVVVGADGRVRLLRSVEGGDLERMGRLGRDWDEGRQAFVLHCGHCHGEDGAETSYSNIKSLAGVSSRLTNEKILEGGQRFGAVDLGSWRESERQTLLLYIEGL